MWSLVIFVFDETASLSILARFILLLTMFVSAVYLISLTDNCIHLLLHYHPFSSLLFFSLLLQLISYQWLITAYIYCYITTPSLLFFSLLLQLISYHWLMTAYIYCYITTPSLLFSSATAHLISLTDNCIPLLLHYHPFSSLLLQLISYHWLITAYIYCYITTPSLLFCYSSSDSTWHWENLLLDQIWSVRPFFQNISLWYWKYLNVT